MKYKSTAEYREEYLALRKEYIKLDIQKDAIQQTLAKKLRLLCRKYPESPVTNSQFKPDPSDFFTAKELIKAPRKWNPNFRYAMNYSSNSLLDYIEQIEIHQHLILNNPCV